MNTTRDELFWSKVQIASDDECWLWCAGLSSRSRKNFPYGAFWNGERRVNAHRYAYESAKGPIPDGLLVRHTCDNPRCCNPSHLLVGTIQDNLNDMRSRGRENHEKTTRLTAQEVLEIRSKHRNQSAKELAIEYKVSRPNIVKIVQRRTWKDI